jgi:hypothetical protein
MTAAWPSATTTPRIDRRSRLRPVLLPRLSRQGESFRPSPRAVAVSPAPAEVGSVARHTRVARPTGLACAVPCSKRSAGSQMAHVGIPGRGKQKGIAVRNRTPRWYGSWWSSYKVRATTTGSDHSTDAGCEVTSSNGKPSVCGCHCQCLYLAKPLPCWAGQGCPTCAVHEVRAVHAGAQSHGIPDDPQ